MQIKLQEVIGYIKDLGADYGDIRLKDIFLEHIKLENGQITNLSNSRSRGVGIRVYVNGGMGFASTSDIIGSDKNGQDSLLNAAKLAYDTALASCKLLNDKAVLSPKEPVRGKYSTTISTDPFVVPLQEKINLLMTASREMTQVPGLSCHEVFMDFRKEDVIFADTDGSYITQVFFQSGGGIAARAIGEDTQQRSYGNIMCGGYEVILDLKLLEHAKKIAKEAVALSRAPACPEGEFDIILMPTQLHLQIHESVGHPTELDRVLGSEAAYAGESFLSPKDVGQQYASEHVTIVADAITPGIGAFGYDDEGVPAQCVTLIDKGIFRNFQTSRDNAPIIGQNSYGMGIADGWNNLPIVRMTNINLQPGTHKLDELIAGVKRGFLLEENKSWSIDDKRINFQFACEIAREIKDGKLTVAIYKNPTYTGKTTEFWGSCDGVCNENYRQVIGIPNCGKGQPMQIMRVSHASSPARFRKVRFIGG